MPRALPWRTAWVTGASSGIGRSIALQLAAAGVTVAASARSVEALSQLGKGIHPIPVDVQDAAAMAAAYHDVESLLGVPDLVIFGAGTYRPVDAARLDIEQFRETVSTNYMGVVYGLAAVAPAMMARGSGQISWIASVAGYVGLPKAASYGPSKAALINLAECLYPEFRRAGLVLSVINPGFVATPLTAQNDFPMPFIIGPEDAASRTIAGLAAGRFEIAYPRRFVLLLKLLRLLPAPLFFHLIDRAVLGPRRA